MTDVLTRNDVHSMIDGLPDAFIQALAPLLVHAVEEYDDEYVSDEDIAISNARYQEYLRDPSVGVPHRKTVAQKL
ncbi:MAG: hypothetical protein LBL41_01225 [Bifidobacteriaceae bacterium]|jgi:hypothetical protein|nr:hypothetical protein [Bifidobacteriaceae bacterium]